MKRIIGLLATGGRGGSLEAGLMETAPVGRHPVPGCRFEM